MQLGKVIMDELQQKFHPKDTSAAGAVLFSKGKTTFRFDRDKESFRAVHEFVIKIKIYKKEGLDLANYEIPYYVGYKDLQPETLKVEDAATYNIADGKIKRTKVNSGAVFQEKVNESWKTAIVVFPDARIGSVIEFKYTIQSENIHAFPTFRFQRPIPVDQVEYVTEIPVSYQYKVLTNGLFPIDTKVSMKSGGEYYENQYGQTSRLSYNVKICTHTASNLPAIKSEDFVDNPENYSAAVEYELELIQFPNVPVRNFSQTWEGLTQTIFKDNDFGGQLNKNAFFLGQLKNLVNGIEDRQERLSRVFTFVQDRMNWNGRNGFFAKDGIEKAWANQSGNVADINLLLVAMLNMAGIPTNPVLISTVDHGVPNYPNQTAFNYVIACATIGDKKILLDATNKYTVPGVLPLKLHNWSGRLVRQDGSSEEMSMSNPNLSKKFHSLVCDVRPDGTLSGKSRTQMSELAGFEYRDRYSGMSMENYAEALEGRYDGIRIENYTVVNEKRSAEPVIETFDFISDKHSEIIGDRIYIDPMLFFTTHASPFVSDDRLMPIFFGYPRQVRYIISLKIPKGYAVESIPEAINITTGENVVNFRIASQSAGESVAISATYETGQMLVNQAFYPRVKDFFARMVAKEQQKIVLKKI